MFKSSFIVQISLWSNRIKMETCVCVSVCLKVFVLLLLLHYFVWIGINLLQLPCCFSLPLRVALLWVYTNVMLSTLMCVYALFPLTQSFFGQIVLVFFSFLPSGRYWFTCALFGAVSLIKCGFKMTFLLIVANHNRTPCFVNENNINCIAGPFNWLYWIKIALK